jgi:hypothetical protein
MVSSCVVLGVHLSIMNMAAFGIVDVFEVGAGSHDPRCNISVGALSAPASARLREFLGDLPDESPPPIVHTKMETQPVPVGQCSAGTQTTVEGGFVGKHATNYMQQVHTNARLSVFYAGCFKNRIAQARMNDTFELAASTLQVPVSKLPSSRTITEQIEAIAALAMAIKGVRLIERGCMDEFFTLILDAGSMRAPLWIRMDPHTLRIRRDRLRIFVFARTALHIKRCADERDAKRAEAKRKAAAAAKERAAKKRKGSHVGAGGAADAADDHSRDHDGGL